MFNRAFSIGWWGAIGLLAVVGRAEAPAPAAAGVLPEEVIFAVRQPRGPHWYENFGHTVMGEDHVAYGAGGRLCRLNPRTGRVRLLVDDPAGAVRDPAVHHDGRRILFAYRTGGSPHFHLYVINADGSGLRQLTDGDCDDVEPAWLPDGGIVFGSSRCNRYVPCWYVQVATLYRCDADGGGVRPLSSNIEQDNTPHVLPDGRILYTRWEYVDRSREHFHHLWVMNPDGTGQVNFYGNQHPGNVFLDARPVPGRQEIVMINSPRHGRREHEGRVALVRTDLGADALEAQTLIADGLKFRDPYPLSSDAFLVARETELLLMNRQGETRELYRLTGELARDGVWLHEPVPLRSRPREPVIAPRHNLAEADGRIVVFDIYRGRQMAGVERGAIKKLLVLENLPKPVNYTGSMDPISYGGSYTLNRVLGTVPVEPDGSVNARVPALRSLQLVALDENDLSVKRMLSFMTVMPGEVATCIGCHENRTEAPPSPAEQGRLLALQRPPSRLTPVAGNPDIFSYPRDLQPIWGRHCLPCHDVEQHAGHVLLTGDAGPMFTHSYFTLSARLQIADGRDLARGGYPPYTIGSATSPLLDKLQGEHYNVRLSPAELRRVKLWIDASATFPDTYAALGSGMIGRYAALQYGTKPKIDYLSWPALKAAREVLDRRCAGCHTGSRRLPASPADNLGLRLHHLAYNGGEPRFWEPPWIRPYGDGSVPVGSDEWMRRYADPRLRFSRHIIYNLSRPECSLQLLAPLAKRAGGHGTCGDVFASRDDPDRRTLLAGIEEAKRYLERITRFDMPGFHPEPEYIREMQRYGILGADVQPGDCVDVRAADRQYWASFWYHPQLHRD